MEEKTKTKKDKTIELIVVIMLGITAVATAWSSWQGGLHGSLMDQSYTKSNNLNAEANSMYNEGVQNLNQDLMIWNQLMGLHIDYAFAEQKGDQDEMEKLEYKINQIMDDSVAEDFATAITWTEGFEEYVSPFDSDDLIETYFAASGEVLKQSEAMLEAGNANNTHGDNQGLVSVIYAVVLFLLGISSSFEATAQRGSGLASAIAGPFAGKNNMAVKFGLSFRENDGKTAVFLADSGSGLGKMLTLTGGATKKVLQDVYNTLREGISRKGL